MKESNKKIAIGLSGGVDSAVAAYLLKEKGYEIVCVHMKCWDYNADGCRGDQDKIDAIRVAHKLDVKFEFLDFQKEYKERVINYFYSEYEAGRTPNPDVLCNREIKFGLFLDWAMKNEFTHVATGHYARVRSNKDYLGDIDSSYDLLTGVDVAKDQSYFLYVLGQKELSKTLFPLGDMKKTQVRELAKQIGLHNSAKPDSVGICFIGDIDVKAFLKERLKEKQGKVVNTQGEVVGKHDGVSFYTIGQRHGFEITKYVGLPLYVVGKDAEKNELKVGFYDEAKREAFKVKEVHWINKAPKDEEFDCSVRIRHLGEFYDATIKNIGQEGILDVKLNEHVFGVAPGQHAVFYDGEKVLGGGVIDC